MSTPGQQPPGGGGVTNTQPPVAVHQTTVIQMGSHKSVVGAVLLALFFGPLGMLYATVVGALVMFFVNIFVAFLTLGLGLFITVPLGALWAGIAASTHNSNLGAMSTRSVTSPLVPNAAPAGWHDDPEGGDRLRYWDGRAWTGHYADRPGAAGKAPAKEIEPVAPAVAEALPQAVAEAPASGGPDPGEAPTVVAETEVQKVFCGSCGAQIGASDRFCAACGESQDEIS